MPLWSEKPRFFWLHSSVFPIEIQSKNVNFQSFFTPKIPFRGYFQENVCTHFQICIPNRQEHSLPDMYPKQARAFQINPRNFEFFWSHSPVFTSEKQPKNLNFEFFLHLSHHLVATFKETRAHTFRKHVSEPSKSIPDFANKLRYFLDTLLLFCFRKTTVKSKFSDFFLPPRDPLVAAFNETRTPASRKYVAEQRIVIPNLSEELQFLW